MARRFRVSLRAVFLLVLVLCVGIGYYLTASRLWEAERELRMRRAETGYLTIDDRSQFHAIAVDTDEPNTWRWRLFVPKGHRYAWRIACESIPRDEPPEDARFMGESNEPYWEQDSEVLVTARLRPNDDGSWQLSVDSRIGDAKNQMGGVSLRIPEEKIRWMSTVSVTDGRLIGRNGTEARDPAGPIILLQRRASNRKPDGSYDPSPGPRPGFMIWLEEQ